VSAPVYTEPTVAGETDLIEGITLIPSTDQLRLRIEAPLGNGQPQAPCDHGLFDIAARNQLDLFTPEMPS
jgi:hypothetical protein